LPEPPFNGMGCYLSDELLTESSHFTIRTEGFNIIGSCSLSGFADIIQPERNQRRYYIAEFYLLFEF